LASIDVDEETIQMDPWYQFSGAVDEFSLIHQKRVARSYWISANEPISAWKPRTTDKRGLPNISFIVQKPKTLGTKLSPQPVLLLGPSTALKFKEENKELLLVRGIMEHLVQQLAVHDGG
jgi:hypothetical protein